MLTDDQAFCSSCFRCRNCKKRIDDTQYARTSQGTFCMKCHQTLLARKKRAAALKATNSSSNTTTTTTTAISTSTSNSNISTAKTSPVAPNIPNLQPLLPLPFASAANPPQPPALSLTGHASSPSLGQYSSMVHHAPATFKEKSLPQLPTEEPHDAPVSPSSASSLNRSNSYNQGLAFPQGISPPRPPPPLERIPPRVPLKSQPMSAKPTLEAPLVSTSHSSPVVPSGPFFFNNSNNNYNNNQEDSLPALGSKFMPKRELPSPLDDTSPRKLASPELDFKSTPSRGGVYIDSTLSSPNDFSDADLVLRLPKIEGVKLDLDSSSSSSSENLEKYTMERSALQTMSPSYNNIPRTPEDDIINRLEPRAASGHYRSASENRLSVVSPLTRELMDARKRITELELQLRNTKNSNANLDSNINEKRKTIAGLEAKGEVAKMELGMLDQALAQKNNLQDVYPELIKRFVDEVSHYKESLRAEIEELMLTRNKLEQKNAELAKIHEVWIEKNMGIEAENKQLLMLNSRLTRSAEEKVGPILDQHDAADDKKSGGRRFWKRPTAAVAKGVKGFNKVFNQDQSQQLHAPLISTGPYSDLDGSITMISNNTVNSSESGEERSKRWFKTSTDAPHMATTVSTSSVISLMGVPIEKRIEYENTNIPLIVTRCVQEVEKRGMEFEGIYRKSGARSQVTSIEEAFERAGGEDVDDAVLDGDISGVTSALKQYLRHLPIPLVPFDVYEDFVEVSREITKSPDYATDMLRALINSLPQPYKECLSYVVQHLVKITQHADVNLMTARNLAVVFAPTLVRHITGEREIVDMQARNDGTQLLIDRYTTIFADVFIRTDPPPIPTEASSSSMSVPSSNANGIKIVTDINTDKLDIDTEATIAAAAAVGGTVEKSRDAETCSEVSSVPTVAGGAVHLGEDELIGAHNDPALDATPVIPAVHYPMKLSANVI